MSSKMRPTVESSSGPKDVRRPNIPKPFGGMVGQLNSAGGSKFQAYSRFMACTVGEARPVRLTLIASRSFSLDALDQPLAVGEQGADRSRRPSKAHLNN